MKVLITGGTGTISSGLVTEAVKRGYETWAITRGNNIRRNIVGVHYLTANVYNCNEVKKVLEEHTFDVIVECLVYDVEQLKISLQNFSNRCSQYIFISTNAVYDRLATKSRIKEDSPKNQVHWPYSKNKIECENYIKEYFKNKRNHYTIIRPTVTYGDYRIPYPIATRTPTWTLFERMKQGIPLLACNNVEHSVIHIDDFSNAVVSLFNNPQAYQEDFHISYNGCEVYWDDVIKTCADILQVQPKIIHVSTKLIKWTFPSIYFEMKWNKAEDLLVDDSKIRKVLPNFKPNVSYKAGLERLVLKAKQEFDNSAAQLDMKWWNDCDLTIFCAYCLNKLNSEERKIAKEYIASWTIDKHFKLICILIKHCTKNQLGKYIRYGRDWR